MDKITIGSSPYGEDCAQVGRTGYEAQAVAECEAFKAQLIRHYEAMNSKPIPASLKLRVDPNNHDFGVYYDVKAYFCDEASEAAAYWLEGNTPEEWDEEARKVLFPDESAPSV